ncbi:hypothetical protein EON65_21465 [archaeon]|nr:MAG: hypothetical protein EON65_21465 [archaeon]
MLTFSDSFNSFHPHLFYCYYPVTMMTGTEEQNVITLSWKERFLSMRNFASVLLLAGAIVVVALFITNIVEITNHDDQGLNIIPETNTNVNTTDLVAFMNTQLLTEAWVEPQYDMVNTGSPLDGFTDEDQLLALGAREITTVFDMFDRQEMKGVATTEFSTFQQVSTWYSTQSSEFQNRYQLVPQPVPLGRAFILGSPGLPVGQFRNNLLGGINFTDMSYTVRGATIPTCDPGNIFQPPPTPASTGSYLIMLMVRSIIGFYSAGQTIKVLTDSHGNIYYGLARRTSNAQGRYGFTLTNMVLTANEQTSCLRSSYVPANANLTQNIICKQLQIVDDVGNTYLFMRGPATLQGEDRITMNPVKHVAGPVGNYMACDDLSLTDPLVLSE